MQRTATFVIALAAMLLCSAAFAQDDAWKAAAAWKWGQPETPLTSIEAEIRKVTPAEYPTIEAKLIEIVNNADAAPEAKGWACRQLKTVGSGRCVAAVAKLLTDEKCSHMARYALEPNADPAAGTALRDALGQTKGLVQVGIISSIAARRDAQAIDALKSLLADSDELVAGAAIRALGAIGTMDAAKALWNANVPNHLKRVHTAALTAAANHLRETGAMASRAQPQLDTPGGLLTAIYLRLLKDPDTAAARSAGVCGLVQALDRTDAVGFLRDMFSQDDPALRQAAIAAYSAATDRELKKIVAEQLPTLKPSAQLGILAVVADQADIPARIPLLNVLNDSANEQVKLAVLDALAVHGEAADVPALVKLATTTDPVASAAKRALERMGKPGVDDALIDLIAKSDDAGREVVLGVLGVRRVESALPNLAKLVAGSDPKIAEAAAKALSVMGTPAQLPVLGDVLVSTENATVRTSAEDAAKAICSRASDKAACAKSLLASLEKARIAAARISLIKLLPFTRDAQAMNAVRGATKDSDAEVKEAAIRTLIDWPEISAASDILDIAKNSANQTHSILAVQGALRLARMKDQPIAQRLSIYRTVLQIAKRPQDKRQALAGLGELPTTGAVDLLTSYLKDAELSQDAASAIARLAKPVAIINSKKAAAALQQAKAAAKSDELRQQLDEAEKQVQNAGQSADGYVIAWMLSGPYTQDGKGAGELFNIAFAPEKGTAEWRPVTATTSATPTVELDKLLGGNDRVAYLRCLVSSTRAQDAVLEVGSDDGVKIWLNKRVVHANNATRPCTPGQDKAKIRLNSGVNELLVKITQGGGEWATCVRIVGPSGQPLNSVTVSLEQ